VVYGLVGLKTHSKTCLVVRQEDDGIRRYWHVGTGNYNPKTARQYEDLGLLSSAPEVGADLTDLFNFLTGYSRRTRYRKLLVAPASLRERIVSLIDEQARAGGRIVLKMNNLVDETVIDALYRASQAGAEIDLVIRGICCLRPGVTGLSERIRVRSIVGRYLEHSRVFAFGDPASGPVRYFIGSADMMPRNLDGRVEVIVPIEDPELQQRLQGVLDVNLADRSQAWLLDADGTWRKLPAGDGVGVHRRLQQLALERGARRPPEALVPVTAP
jgi:polyphosphate kinase